MKKLLLFSAIVLLSATSGGRERLVEHVNPFVGTDGFGNVYPGAQVPFGGIQISPDTAAGTLLALPALLGACRHDCKGSVPQGGQTETQHITLQEINDGADSLFVMSTKNRPG